MNIFIGCSSKNEISNEYFEETKEILNKITENNNLVFGVSENGIMGQCYNVFKQAGRKVIGITNETYAYEFKNVPCDEEYIVYSTLERTNKIIKCSDIFLFLPGGVGTYAEILHIFEELRTYKINKKIIIYNYNDFFNDLINILDKLVKEKFLDSELLKYIKITKNKEELATIINN